jgi:hypothetical protein
MSLALVLFALGIPVFWHTVSLAMEVCPGQRIYLKPGEEIAIELGHRPGCTVNSMALERGTVGQRLQYPSGKMASRTWTSGQGDNPEFYSELPSKVYFIASTEAVIRFLAQRPTTSPQPKVATPPAALPEACGGHAVTLQPGEEFSFRLGQRCQEPVKHIHLNGTVEEHVVYPSGKTVRRSLQSGINWNYDEWPSRITWKATTTSYVTFAAQAPAMSQKPSQPVAEQGAQRPNPNAGASQQSSVAAADSANTLFLLLLSHSLMFGAIFVVIRLTKSSSVFVQGHWSTLIENLQASPKEFFASVEKQIDRRRVPAMEYSRVDWKEGGLFSAEREYLRVSRERNVLADICAAPYGTGFFVSWWLAELRPSPIGPTLAVLALLFNTDNTVMNQAAGIATSDVQLCDGDANSPNCPATDITKAGGVKVTKTYNTPLFFTRFLNGASSTNITVSSTAWLGGPSGTSPELPVVLCEQAIYSNPNDPNRECVSPYSVKFSPNGRDNGGYWNGDPAPGNPSPHTQTLTSVKTGLLTRITFRT